MTRRILLITALWAVGLGAKDAGPLAQAVDSIGITVSDLDRSVAFFTDVLTFEKVWERESHGDAVERSTGVFGARVRTARLRLGREHIELTEFLAPAGRPLPADSRSNDLWFQHIAIVTSDMDKAYARLRQHKVRHISAGPQRLPDWNPNAGGIQAFYFQDPDGHALEIISFPDGKGDPRWREQKDRALFLGIDHTAIAVSDIDASTKFYGNVLGLSIAGESENYGPEQERLNAVFGARLRIRALRAADGPGVEFLQYLSPGGGRPYPADAKANDLIHWQTRVLTRDAQAAAKALRTATGGQRTLLVRDPDGHAVQIVEQ